MPRVKSSETVPASAAASTPATPKAARAPKTPKVAAAVVEPAVAAASAAISMSASASVPVAVKKEKKEKEKKEKKEKVAAAAPAPAAAAPAAGDEALAAEGQAQESPSEFTEFMSKLQQLTNLVSSLKSEFRTLEKKANKDLKTVAKANAKRKRKNVNRAPSGFVKPTLISAELASFLGKTAGTEMARTEVTREINAYIREHQLQDKSNGRIINADTKLSSLLKIPAGEELTYFNLQRYMSPHFTKVSAQATA
jgi:chromatin remodeling complex protein RSC6